MTLTEILVTVSSVGFGTGGGIKIAGAAIEWWKERRADALAGSAHVRTAEIADRAALTAELWSRLANVEKRQDNCETENKQLRGEIAGLRAQNAHQAGEIAFLRSRVRPPLVSADGD